MRQERKKTEYAPYRRTYTLPDGILRDHDRGPRRNPSTKLSNISDYGAFLPDERTSSQKRYPQVYVFVSWNVRGGDIWLLRVEPERKAVIYRVASAPVKYRFREVVRGSPWVAGEDIHSS